MKKNKEYAIKFRLFKSAKMSSKNVDASIKHQRVSWPFILKSVNVFIRGKYWMSKKKYKTKKVIRAAKYTISSFDAIVKNILITHSNSAVWVH